jgi:hypothetical protein
MGAQDRVDLAVVDDVFTWPPIGVMLTNAVSPDDGMGGYTGGYCVVGCSDPMVVRLASSSGTPATAAKLYLQKADGTAGGATDQADEAVGAPCPLGYCLSVGPTGATRLRYMTWEPQPPNSVTIQRSSDLAITGSTVLVDFASAAVKAGRRYRLEADLQFTAAADGGIKAGWAATASVSAHCVTGDLFETAPANAYVMGTQLTPGGYPLFATGPTVGHVLMDGIIHADADGSLSIQAAQNASKIAATTILKESWLRVTEV